MHAIQIVFGLALALTFGVASSDQKVERNRLLRPSTIFESDKPPVRVCATSSGDVFAIGTGESTTILHLQPKGASEVVEIQPKQIAFSPAEAVLGIVTNAPKGKYSSGGTVVFWDYKTSKEAGRVAITNGREKINVIGAGTFGPDGKHYVVGSSNGINLGGLLTLIDVKKRSIVAQTDDISRAVVSIAFTDDADLIYAGTVSTKEQESDLYLWNRKSGKTRSLLRSKGDMWSIAISNTHKLVFVGGSAQDGESKSSIIIWDPVKSKIVKTLVGHQKTVAQLAIDEDEKYMASGDIDGNLVLWKLPTMELVGTASIVGSPEVKWLSFVKSELHVGTADGKIQKFPVAQE